MIPLSTTTISVLRTPEPDRYAEPYSGNEVVDRTVIATNVRAVIGRPKGTESVEGGEQSVSDLDLFCDPVALRYDDLVKDLTSDITYRVTWVFEYANNHVEARLRLVEGVL